jgi:hypothetical protein
MTAYDSNGTVTALAGRRIDAPGVGERRFPAQNEAVVKQRIRNMLVGTASTAVVSSAACGADILALECAEALGLRRRVVLPFSRERFRSTSVVDRGEKWGARFDAVLSKLPKDDIIELNFDGSEDDGYAAANARILEEASQLAEAQGQRALAAVVWNGIARGAADVTDAFQKLAAGRRMEVVSVRTI